MRRSSASRRQLSVRGVCEERCIWRLALATSLCHRCHNLRATNPNLPTPPPNHHHLKKTTAFGESCRLPIPEIVAVGGQSDGKSSLLEALLGFRFNVREVEMGTRRPLIVQMVHDPAAKEPRCRLQDEDGGAFGEPLPEARVADEIARRTQEHLARLGGAAVSDKPIVMRAE